MECAKLTSVILPDSIVCIEPSTFGGCSGLTNFTIPNTVKGIGKYAFGGCSHLTSINIPESVDSIGEYAFNGCSSLTSISLPQCITNIIGLFCGCTSLKSISIPEGVTYIGGDAFIGCTSLTNIVIPSSVSSIHSSAFWGCDSITSVIWKARNCNAFEFGSNVTSFTFGEEVEIIPSSICKGMNQITSINIPGSVKSIGAGAFSGCVGLTRVDINDISAWCNISFIDKDSNPLPMAKHLYIDGKEVTNLNIPEGVTCIGDFAFSGFSNLERLTIPTSVASIGNYAFEGCSRLANITNYAIMPQSINDDVFIRNRNSKESITSSCKLHVFKESIDLYKSAETWKKFSEILHICAKGVYVTNITISATETTFSITWPQVSGADIYELVVKDENGNIVCKLVFDSNGYLISHNHHAPCKENTYQGALGMGYMYTIDGLEENKSYSYTITAIDSNGNTIKTETGTFATQESWQNLDDVQTNNVQCTKLLRDGQTLIQRGEKTYTLQGQEVIVP